MTPVRLRIPVVADHPLPVGIEQPRRTLQALVVSPLFEKPDEAAFAASRDGKAFITGSSDRWGQAAVAFGTDPDAARAAARLTTAFYTGESAEPA